MGGTPPCKGLGDRLCPRRFEGLAHNQLQQVRPLNSRLLVVGQDFTDVQPDHRGSRVRDRTTHHQLTYSKMGTEMDYIQTRDEIQWSAKTDPHECTHETRIQIDF